MSLVRYAVSSCPTLFRVGGHASCLTDFDRQTLLPILYITQRGALMLPPVATERNSLPDNVRCLEGFQIYQRQL